MSTSASIQRDRIDLLKGHPNPALLPIDLIKDATQKALSNHDIAVSGLSYGPDPGFEPLRKNIAAWLNAFYQPVRPTESEQICITGGASQNLGCMLGAYTDPVYTRNIWIVAPAYFLSFRIFEDAGFAGKLRAVPEDGEGLDIAYLSKEIAKSEEHAKSHRNDKPTFKPDRDWAKTYRHIIYCVPSFSNPTSRTMSYRRRKELVELARQYDALVVADDVYDFLRWPADVAVPSQEDKPLPRLVDIDAQFGHDGDGFGNAISNGSFSKIAGPGLRCGWCEGSKKFAFGVSQAGIQKSGGAPSQLTSTYVSHLLETGQLQRHIKHKLLPSYASRYAAVMSAVQEHLLPLGFLLPQEDREIVGGYFVWLGLPAGLTGVELTKACLKTENVVIIPGEAFEVPGDNHTISFPSSIRICIAWEDDKKLGEAIARVGRCAQHLLDRQYVLVRG